MKEDLYRLKLTGVTFNQIESGVYALILDEETTRRRLPIIIGYPEAQAIECKLQDIKTPRPLTHDLMVTIMDTFGLSLKSVVIRKLPTGVFAADINLSDGTTTRTVDSRSSDAIALAIRVGAPIYTTEEVLEEAGYDPEERKEKLGDERREEDRAREYGRSGEKSMSELTLHRLNQLMQKAVESEDYEEAARIKKEIDSRTESNDKKNE